MGEAVAVASDRDVLGLVDAYWRAANYLSVGQIYLLDNPLLRELVALPGAGGRPRLGLAVPDDAAHQQVRVVESGTERGASA